MEKEIKKDTNQKPFLASETKKNYKHAPLYRSISNENYSKISYKNILKKFEVMGIQKDDPRLRYFFENMKDKKLDEKVSDESFNDILENQSKLFQKVLKGNLAVPDFTSFSNEIKDIYKKTRTNNQGKVADYIPQLKRVDPGMYGISVCTIDGQRYSIGDTNEYFCVQSTCKPINYCIALDDLGEDFVHKHVGHEPSGKGFNELTLNDRGLPHNPMINSGAIMTSSMLKPNLNIADRFDYVLNMWKKLSGSHRIGFNNSVYLSEKQTADRNFALSYFMRENNAFPENTNLLEVLEFYFQCCSIEITTDAMSIVAGTLANGGVCPTTGIKVFHPETVKNCLSLMYSCGMYDFSGEFAFRIGLPAKSGVSGAVLLVIPNVMGIAIWSPKLDSLGNSVKGLHFCEELIKKYSLHNYDTLIISQQSKKDPRYHRYQKENRTHADLCWAASRGDLLQIQQMVASGINLNQADYDGRTPAHIAASEGQLECLKYFSTLKVSLDAKDRWGNTPLDDAKRGLHSKTEEFLHKTQVTRTKSRLQH